MFDFFKDEIRRAQGIDADPYNKNAGDLKGQKKKDRFIYSAGFKSVTYAVFSLYLVVTIRNIFFLHRYTTFLSLFADVFPALLALAVCVFLILSTRTFEILALAGTVLFAVILYLSMFI